jgi:Zn-dependent protease
MVPSVTSEMSLAVIDDTPFVIQPKTMIGLAMIGVAAYVAARLHRPRWSRPSQIVLALFWFTLYEIADSLHSIGHIRSARQVGAKMDQVLLVWGIQVTQYSQSDVTPRQHIGRAIGGPLMTGALTLSAMPLYTLFGRIPIIGALVECWLICNALILTAALTPTPNFDGASILKWATVIRTGEEALGDEAVQQAGSLVIAGFGLASLLLILRGKWRASLGALGAGIAAAADLFVLRGRLP